MDASSQSRSGIHRLPDKILSSIFLNAINECDDSAEVAFLPLTLSHTSSRWREVCVSTSFLWTSIYMSLPYRHNQSTIQNQLVYLRTWISRSDSSPLNIHLDFRDPEWDWNEETHRFTSTWASQIFSIILPHANRWKHIEFIADTWAPIHVFLAASAANSSESLQLLESMALSRCNAYFARKGELFKPVSLREPVPLFGGARLPSLRGLSLAGVHH
ncbi:hypothetical protein BT96DRAFT_203027 [Gymnopus androsaceus JB14]|uniref:Uncharacterized protein n=1 Tax=Gymnopus androsaceus JB14 TaxID=1447944 RepID=A0A6A4I7U8_9AGAR|nr:hypothetical protein BT96DRAFT_203027 [Gymnopus androsaceus JB14]